MLHDINDEELEVLYSCNSTLHTVLSVQKFRDTCFKNHTELNHFLLSLKKYKPHIDPEEALFESNRLLLNYLNSFSSFLDRTSKMVSEHIGKDTLILFKEECSLQFDNNFSYRFLYKLRNFITHFDNALTFYTEDKDGIHLFMERNNLLKYKEWGKVKKELHNLSDEIDIIPLLEPLNVSINVLYFQFIYYFSRKIVESLNHINYFFKKYSIKNPPILLISESEEDYLKKEWQWLEIETKEYINLFKELDKHPKISLKKTN